MNKTTVLGTPLIIDRPEWQSVRQRIIYRGITLGFWAIWCYLCLPFVSALAWIFGLEISYHHMIYLDGYERLLQLAVYYLLVIVLMGGSLLLWALYNYCRFHGHEQRRAHPAVNIDAISLSFGVEESLVEKCQYHKKITVYHNAQGHIISIEYPTLMHLPFVVAPKYKNSLTVPILASREETV